jgi:hypothetical protein
MDEQQGMREPQGYIAEKISIFAGALSAALRSLGLRVKTADDSIPPAGLDSPSSPTASLGTSGSPHHPVLQDIGASVDRAVQDAATAEPETRHMLHEALEEERMARHNPMHTQALK